MKEETKKCTKCKKYKIVEDFPKDVTRKDGLSYRCNECNRAVSSEYQKSHKERRREIDKKKRSNNPELYRKIDSEWRANNKERIRKYNRKIEQRNIEKLTDRYIKNRLRMWAECSSDLISLKRQQLQINRLSRDLKKTIKEVFK